MKQSFWKKVMAGLSVGMVCGLLVWLISQMLFQSFFYRIEAQTYDWRLRRVIEQPENPIDDIVIIDVDERSVQKLGTYHHWPRTYWERLIKYLSDARVKMIGIDYIFDPDKRYPEEDKAFQRAIFETGNVCSALYFSQADTEHFRPAMVNEPPGLDYTRLTHQLPENLFQNLLVQDRLEPEYPEFLNASKTAGYVNLYPDPDGVIRRIPIFLRFNNHVYSAFAFQMALELMQIDQIDYNRATDRLLLRYEDGQQSKVPLDPYAQLLIYYAGGFKSFRYISFYDVLMEFTSKDYLKDKVVLIGSSLPGLFDLRTTPLQAAYPGVEINANILYQIMNERFIYQMSDLTRFILIILSGLLAGLILIFPRPLGSIFITAGLIFFIILTGLYIMESFSYWVPVVSPIFTVIVAFASTYVYRYLFEERDKRRIRKVFSHYVSTSVVDVLLKHPEKVKLGGEKKVCTALFSDVAGFTSISEQLAPEELVTLLNEYLTEMTNIIFANQGMLDKYEGDAIMAVFGAPVEMENHAALACHSALQMQKRLNELRVQWKKFNKPQLYARIGINTGEMVVGNMGSSNRFDYTVMGDSVNLASRLEGANKLYDTGILIGEQTQELIKERFITRPLDMLRVKGKKKPVKVYELIVTKEETLDSAYQEMLIQYKKGFENYLLRNWEWAINHFRQALQIKSDDGPSRLYLLRCQEFMSEPPGEEWDGVFVMKTK